jgi:hypothetical protein
MRFRPNTSVGNADRSRLCGDFFYDVVLRKFLGPQWRFAQKSA